MPRVWAALAVRAAFQTDVRLWGDVARFVAAAARSDAHLAAENLLLNKQLTLHVERQVKPVVPTMRHGSRRSGIATDGEALYRRLSVARALPSPSRLQDWGGFERTRKDRGEPIESL